MALPDFTHGSDPTLHRPQAEDSRLLSCPRCGANYDVRNASGARSVQCPTCSVDLAPPRIERVLDVEGPAAPAEGAVSEGKPFGRYRLLSQLGHGGMGVVWKAWDTGLRRHVAIKGILAFGEADRTQVERFQREAQAAARLRHPNIVTVHDVGLIEGQHYICSDFVDGESLEKRMGKAWPVRKALELVRAVAGALQYAHDQGIVHRDVKPANILLDARDQPFVADFGLAKDVKGSDATAITGSGDLLGTPSYMSPEQARGDARRIGPASDQFSLGVVLYELLTGKRPFVGESHLATMKAVADADPPRPTAIQAKIHRDVETICLKALEKDETRRYGRIGDLAADIGRYLDGEPIEAQPIGTLARLARKAGKHRAIVVPSALAVLLGVAAAIGAGMASEAREGREAAERHLAKAKLVADVFGRWGLLAGTIEEMERIHYDARVSEVERRAAIGERWQAVEAFLTGTPKDSASQATARALATWPKYLWTTLPEAAAWAREACAIDSEVPFPHLMLALLFVAETLDRAPMPTMTYASTGLAFTAPDPETPEHAQVRAEVDRLLSEADRRPVWGREGATAFRSTAAGFVAFQRGDYDAADRAFLAAISSPELRSLRNTLLAARATARFCRMAFEEALADREEMRKARPGSGSLVATIGDIQLAIAFRQGLSGQDPREGYRTAIGTYDEALRLEPGMDGVRLGRALSLECLAQAEADRGLDPRRLVARALADYDAELAAYPQTRRRARLNRGELLSWWGMALIESGGEAMPVLDEAVRDFTILLDQEAHYAPALAARANAHARRGRAMAQGGADPRPAFEQAIADLDRALELDPASESALLRRAQATAQLGEADLARRGDPVPRYERAEADIQEARRRYPASLAPIRELAWLRMRQSDLDARRGGDARPRLDEAIQLLDRFLQALPRDVDSLMNRGRAHSWRGDASAKRGDDPRASFDLAVADLDAVLAINPDHREAPNNRGNAWLRRAEWERDHGLDPADSLGRAVKDLDEAVTRTPTSWEAWSSRAAARLRVAEDRMGRGQEAGEWIDGAIADLGEALDRSGQDADLLLNRGAAWYFRGQSLAAKGQDPRGELRKAIADYGTLLAADPNHVDGRMNRAGAYIELAAQEKAAGGDSRACYDRALEDLEAILSRSPKLWQAWLCRGEVQEGIGDLEKAVECYERALRIAGDQVPDVKARLDAARAKLPR